MLCATSTREEVWQPPNRAAPAKASARLSDFFIVLFLVASIENEAVFALVAGGRRRVAGRPVDLVEAAEQDGGGIGRVLETVIRPRQVLPRHRPCDVRRHDDHQLGLPIDVVAALEQSAEYRQLHQAGEPLMACLVCSWIMPAIASAPPDGISTVVSARRVLIEGMFWVL